MSRSSRSTRSPVQQESVPFLNPAQGSDFDLELQSLEAENGSSYTTHPFGQVSDGLNRDRCVEDLDEDTHQSVTYGKVPRGTRILQDLLSHIYTGSRRRSSKAPKHSLLDRDRRKRRPLKSIWRTFVVLLMLMGLLQFTNLLLGLVTAFFPDKLDHAFRTWRNQDVLQGRTHYPTDYTSDILPVPCHSHNDYWRSVPLKSAIQAGCTSVEADVWLVKDDLYVGHEESALTANRTFTSLYINPLVQILERQNPITEFQPSPKTPRNGVFDMNLSESLILLIDFKTSYEELWPVVSAQLEPLRRRQYLTHFNGTAMIQGPVTVVVTGNAPFDYVVSDMTYRDMFFDAPLDALASLADKQSSLAYNPGIELEYLSSIRQSPNTTSEDSNQGQGHSGHPPTNPAIFTRANSYFASVSFKASIGLPKPYFSPAQRQKILAQVAGAHAQGLKVRYWETPSWPIGLRNYIWRELVKMKVDYLNVDDLYGATKGDWRSGHSIWAWSLWGGRDW